MSQQYSLPVRRPGPGTPVTVVGLARSGAAAAQWLLKLGCIVRVTEAASSPALKEKAQELASLGAMVELGKHTKKFVEDSHLVVASPGVPLTAQPLRWARLLHLPVVGELELGSWYCPGRMVAVTGSNGKSTVVTLLGEILKAGGRPTVVGGNLGTPLCSLLEQITPQTLVVLEVSSFQLEMSLAFHTEIACILNITENHLDRHRSFTQYAAEKARLFSYQKESSWAVLNADDPVSFSFRNCARGRLATFSRTKKGVGAFGERGWLRLDLPWVSGSVCRREDLLRPGDHHVENALAAICMAGLLGVKPETMGEALRTFRGLAHRQEVIATIDGVTFVNDSKSTTVASGMKALEAAPAKVVLIAGGRDKGSNFRILRNFKEKLKAAILIGEDGPKIEASLKGSTTLVRAGSLREAVQTSFQLAKRGEWVLLSPMCTSFDMFRDFEERGELFSEEVKALARGLSCAA